MRSSSCKNEFLPNGVIVGFQMKDIAITTLLLVACSSIILISNLAESCNEAVCASVVSKCMLTQSCKCDLKNCSCCQECFQCLSYLYNECCSCVGKYC